MADLHITAFGGLNTAVSPRLSKVTVAQVAHNCLLWDGSLRPMAKWIDLNVHDVNKHSINLAEDDVTLILSPMVHAKYLSETNHPKRTVVGLAQFQINAGQSNIAYQNYLVPPDTMYEVGIMSPEISIASTINYIPQHHSKKPVNRIYGITSVRYTGDFREESPMTVVPNQDPTALMFEGDLCQMDLTIDGGGFYERTHHRLYRSVSGLDTGHSTGNAFDTEWHLVADLYHTTDKSGLARNYKYNDGGSVTNTPFDVYLTKEFYPPRATSWRYFTVTEGDNLVAAQEGGEIAVSERHMIHAWPTQNYFKVPSIVTGMVAHYDNVFIGTKDNPYILTLSYNEHSALQGFMQPFPANYECLDGTMVETNAGAMYATNAGLVELTKDGAKLLTSGVANSMTPLFHAKYLDESVTPSVEHCVDVNFKDTSFGAYLNGAYFGFCAMPRTDGKTLQIGYLYTTGNSSDGDHPMQRLVTFDPPNATIFDSTKSSDGIALLTSRLMPQGGNPADVYNTAWSMPLPNTKRGQDYHKAAKMCYRWRSRKFVFPGINTMAYAKVVHNSGFVKLKIFVEGCCTYETRVDSCKPFALPPHMVGVEWEVEVEGTAQVHEIHLAPSIVELL